MKKLMYLLPVAALAMASCSNSDDAAIEQGAAQQLAKADQLILRPSMGGANTRTSTVTTANIPSFHLLASGSFFEGASGAKGTTETTSLDYTINRADDGAFPLFVNGAATGEQYWWGESNATFKAWHPATQAFSGGQADITIPVARANQQDYVVAYNEGTKNDFKSGVPLNFQHVTSQIVIQAKNADPDFVKISVKASRMVNIQSKATLTLPTVATNTGFSWDNYTPWSNFVNNNAIYSSYEDATSVTATPVVLTSTAADIMFGDAQYLLPQQLTKATLPAGSDADDYAWDKNLEGNAIAFLINIEQLKADDGTALSPTKFIYPQRNANSTLGKDGTTGTDVTITSSDFAWAYVPVDTQWEPGKKYIYTLNFSKDSYGQIDPNPGPGGVYPPKEDEPTDPGDPVVEKEIPLTFSITVEEWTEAPESIDL